MKPFLCLPLLILLSLGLWRTGRAQDTVIASQTIIFPSGHYRLPPAELTELKGRLKFMAADSPVSVLVEGHSDSMGNYARNKLLSMKRAMSVQRWLRWHGVAEAGITVRAWGSDRPAAGNGTVEGRRKNRRVELYFSRPVSAAVVVEKEEPSIAELYQQIGTPLQRFCVNPSRDTVIRCAQGTVIYIKAGSLIAPPDCEGNCVTFNVREDYLASDMLLDDLSTMSDGRVLETQGMVYTEAVDCRGNKLELQKGKELVILMPTDSINPDAKIFDGRRDSNNVMNCKLDSVPVLSNFKLRDLNQCRACGRQRTICRVCPFFFCRMGRFVKYIRACFSEKQRVEYEAYQRCQMVPPDIPVKLVPVCGQLEELFKKYGVNDIESLTLAINRPLLDSFKVKTVAALEDTLEKIKTKKIELDYMNRSVSIDDLRYYVFNTSKLGWVNVDCFSEVRNREKVMVKVNLPAGPNTDCKLVFRDRRAILAATREGVRFKFQGVPKNERAVIVAIRYEGGGALLATREIVTSGDSFDMEWKRLSVDELRQELKKLDR